MLPIYAHALIYLVLSVRTPLMLLALAIAGIALATALFAKQQQTRPQAAQPQPQAKILQFRPRTTVSTIDEEQRAA
jgi:hypothetical protein